MKLLFVVHDYLPIGSTKANILSKLIPIMQKNGHGVSILTAKSKLNFDDIPYESIRASFLIYTTKYVGNSFLISKILNLIYINKELSIWKNRFVS